MQSNQNRNHTYAIREIKLFKKNTNSLRRENV